MTSNLQRITAVVMILLCGLLCISSATAMSVVATDNGPGTITYDGQTLQASELTICRDGDSSTVYTGDDLTVTLTLSYIDGEETYVGTSNCNLYFNVLGEFTNSYLPDPDESDSRASKANPASIVYHIPGEVLDKADSWKATACWKSAVFTDTDGTIYNLIFTVNEHSYIPVFTPAYEKIITPTPTQLPQTATPTSIVIATTVPTNIPTPGATLPAGIPTPTGTAEPTAVATTPTIVPTGAPTEAVTATSAATALPTTAPAAPEVPTTATTGTVTPEETGIAAGTTAPTTLVPTEATDTPVPATPSPMKQEPQGIPFGWIFGVALLIIIVGGGAYLIGTQKNRGISPIPEENAPEPEESKISDDTKIKTE